MMRTAFHKKAALILVLIAALVVLVPITKAHTADSSDNPSAMADVSDIMLSGHASEPASIPMVMVVVGFDGGDDPEAAVPYEDGDDWSVELFGENETPAAYYRDMSEGSFTFAPAAETSEAGVAGNTNAADRPNDGIVHVTLHRGHGAWGAVNVDPTVTRDFANFVMEALNAAEPFIDFASFDKDGDGSLSAKELSICLCVAGYEAASVTDFRREDVPLTWAHSGMLSIVDDELRTIDGVCFTEYIAIAERYWNEWEPLDTAEIEPLGVLYHELGHALGLPDLYAVSITEGPWSGFSVGTLSLMDSGGWQYADDGEGLRNIPTSLDAWSRYVLGWTNPAIIARRGDYTVSSELSDAGYSQLIIPTDNPTQYYIIENRQPEGQDIGLTEEHEGDSGLVVWHVDNAMYDRYYRANRMNDADHRPGVMSEELNGETELLLYSNADDVPEAQMGSGIVVTRTSDPGHDMTVHVEIADDDADNVLNLLGDEARADLSMARQDLLEEIIWFTRCVLQGL